MCTTGRRGAEELERGLAGENETQRKKEKKKKKKIKENKIKLK